MRQVHHIYTHQMQLLNLRFLAFAGLCWIATNAIAEGPAIPSEPSHFPEFVQGTQATCAPAIARLVDRQGLAKVFSKRPVDVQSVCRCSSSSMLRDSKLIAMFNVPEEKLAPQLEGESALMDYFRARMMQTLFECLSIDIEKSLALFKVGEDK